MDIGRAFSYPFKDPKWLTKVLIFALLVFVPIFGWIVNIGYSLRIMKNVFEGNDVPLPEWDHFGLMFAEGLKAFFVAIVWFIPAIVIGLLLNLVDNFIFTLLSRIVFALGAAFVWAAVVPVALSGEIAEGLKFEAIIERVRANLGDYIIILVVGLVASVISSFGVVGACLGAIVSLFYLWLVQSHLAAQAYSRSTSGETRPPTQAF
jgi:MFS family permease